MLRIICITDSDDSLLIEGNINIDGIVPFINLTAKSKESEIRANVHLGVRSTEKIINHLTMLLPKLKKEALKSLLLNGES